MIESMVGTIPRVWQNQQPAPVESRLPVREPPSAEQRLIDVTLLTRIRDGDEAALPELYARFSGPIYSLAYQVVRDASAAEDIVQEVFLAVWRDARRFDASKGSAAAWLFSMARHKAIDLLRRQTTARRRTTDADLTLEAASDDVEAETWWRIRRERVLDRLAELTPIQREAVELAFFAGLTHVEVAERLAIPLGTAKTRIRSGLLRLRELLGDSVSDGPAEVAR